MDYDKLLRDLKDVKEELPHAPDFTSLGVDGMINFLLANFPDRKLIGVKAITQMKDEKPVEFIEMLCLEVYKDFINHLNLEIASNPRLTITIKSEEDAALINADLASVNSALSS